MKKYQITIKDKMKALFNKYLRNKFRINKVIFLLYLKDQKN